jgi:predicted nucleic acid-binding protein
MIVLDTGGLYAALDENESLHERCAAALLAAEPPRILSPFVLAELDYLIGKRMGQSAALSLLDEVARGVYRLEAFDEKDVALAQRIIERYEKLEIGLADASVVVLADRHRTRDLLCTDQRHFRQMTARGRKPFRLLPYDA